jgi:hypothetical protein
MSQEGIEKVFVLDGQQRLQTLFAICFHFGGVILGANSIGMVFEMPLDVESFEQGVAWIWYGIGEKFQPRFPTPG